MVKGLAWDCQTRLAFEENMLRFLTFQPKAYKPGDPYHRIPTPLPTVESAVKSRKYTPYLMGGGGGWGVPQFHLFSFPHKREQGSHKWNSRGHLPPPLPFRNGRASGNGVQLASLGQSLSMNSTDCSACISKTPWQMGNVYSMPDRRRRS